MRQKKHIPIFKKRCIVFYLMVVIWANNSDDIKIQGLKKYFYAERNESHEHNIRIAAKITHIQELLEEIRTNKSFLQKHIPEIKKYIQEEEIHKVKEIRDKIITKGLRISR